MNYLKLHRLISWAALLSTKVKKAPVSKVIPTTHQAIKLFTFNIDKEQRWYINIPNWTGNKADLEMVQGADKMLDYIAHGDRTVALKVSERPFVNATPLILIDADLPQGGGIYLLKEYKGNELNQELWLCDVTTHIFGRLPRVIYFENRWTFTLNYIPHVTPDFTPYSFDEE